MMLSFFTKGIEKGAHNLVFKVPALKKEHKEKAEKVRAEQKKG